MQPSARGRLRAADLSEVDFASKHLHCNQRQRAGDGVLQQNRLCKNERLPPGP